MKKTMILCSLLLSGCYSTAPAPLDGGLVSDAPVACASGNEACAAWTARTTALGCPESETWPCPWAGLAVDRACLDELEATSSCAEAYAVPTACEVCR